MNGRAVPLLRNLDCKGAVGIVDTVYTIDPAVALCYTVYNCDPAVGICGTPLYVFKGAYGHGSIFWLPLVAKVKSP